MGRNGIPPLDRPGFETSEGAGLVANDFEPVIAFKVNGEAGAYPLSMLTWH